jgi:hypothetical protein
MTLAQIAEKPITVTTREAIKSLTESRPVRLPMPAAISLNQILLMLSACALIIAAGLSGDNAALIS